MQASKTIFFLLAIFAVLAISVVEQASARKSKGEDILLYNGNIVIRGGKKNGGNIVLANSPDQGGNGNNMMPFYPFFGR